MQNISEVIVTRGSDANRTSQKVEVYVPANAKNIRISAAMANEVWGGAHHPPKDDTDDLGSTDYKQCPMGAGDCPIAWSSVSSAICTSMPNGQTKVEATFYNWAGRNDRKGILIVDYDV